VWDLDADEPADPRRREDQAGKTIPGMITAGKPDTSTSTTARTATSSASRSEIPQENMWVLPTAAGARMLPRNGGVGVPMSFDPTTRSRSR